MFEQLHRIWASLTWLGVEYRLGDAPAAMVIRSAWGSISHPQLQFLIPLIASLFVIVMKKVFSGENMRRGNARKIQREPFPEGRQK
ncbi:hypothetical protein NYO99_00910 [Pelomonas sp. UHG3]|jgi:hypothetical protein|uniref:Uncharacterized protein n=1 Tax=Roseateles hydrophilus TaxID=2975054 RepID=A0ACC6C549_9BURK|nr:hypothetical protein [Pelomonas sp. UHG3]MCY4743526.1 hypothetical protein [Pelomonas sp. UHG3]